MKSPSLFSSKISTYPQIALVAVPGGEDAASSRIFGHTLKWSFENISVLIIFLLGILLRLRQYFIGRSLWVDEAMLALNIVNRNFAGLLKPLDLDQGAPIGFLLVEKVFNLLLGRNEYSLRLFPLLLGLALVMAVLSSAQTSHKWDKSDRCICAFRNQPSFDLLLIGIKAIYSGCRCNDPSASISDPIFREAFPKGIGSTYTRGSSGVVVLTSILIRSRRDWHNAVLFIPSKTGLCKSWAGRWNGCVMAGKYGVVIFTHAQ